MTDLIGWIIATISVIVTVMVHYEVMLGITDHLLPLVQRQVRGRRRMILTVVALMCGHILEIWLFAAIMLFLCRFTELGSISGNDVRGFTDYLYYSAVSYTSLGDSKFHPEGIIRNLTAAEALAGILMIGWSASFTYLNMEHIWKAHRADRGPRD